MTGRRVGWYVHHHGNGHLARFLAVRPHLDADVTVFSSLPRPGSLPASTDWVPLPLDSESEVRDGELIDPAAAEPTAHGRLHWAPLGHLAHRARLAQIAEASSRLDAFVVDVSVEVTLFARLLGLPVALFTQPGRRDDAPHRLAFDVADVVIAPWPIGLHALDSFGDAEDRVAPVGGITRHAGRTRSDPVAGRVLLLGGMGPAAYRAASWDALVTAAPELDFRSAGFLPGSFSDDPWEELCRAEVVVSAAGQNSVADMAAAGARAVLVPQDRPFDEQHATARALERAGTVQTVREVGDTAAFLAAVRRARGSAPDWSSWGTSEAAATAASLIADLRA